MIGLLLLVNVDDLLSFGTIEVFILLSYFLRLLLFSKLTVVCLQSESNTNIHAVVKTMVLCSEVVIVPVSKIDVPILCM